jgi:putative Mn2+ efflux pump MntP
MKSDKWLKALLMVNGVFFVTCFAMPLLGLFTEDMKGANWIGTAVLEFWCMYFIPVGILSFIHFKRKPL